MSCGRLDWPKEDILLRYLFENEYSRAHRRWWHIITVKEKLLAFAMTCTLRILFFFVSLAAEILGLIGYSSSWRGGGVVECLVC